MNEYTGVIHKYPLNIGGLTVIKTPKHSKFLSLKQQNDIPVAYFLVIAALINSEHEEKHIFYTVGTGHRFQKEFNFEFIDTLLFNDGEFVLHAFKSNI